MDNEESSQPGTSPKEKKSASHGEGIFYRAFAKSVFSRSFRGTFGSLALYWKIYGGLEALIVSPFMIVAALTTALCAPLWDEKAEKWTGDAITVLPCLLGFSVSALAIVLTFPSNPIFKHFSEEGSDDSYYMGVSARLVHFILAQVAAFFFTFINKAYGNFWLSGFGFLLFMYAIFAAAATGLSFFTAARMFNASEKLPNPPKDIEVPANDQSQKD